MVQEELMVDAGAVTDCADHDGPAVVSKSEFADLLGVSKARVSQLVSAGMPVTEHGKVAVAEAQAWCDENVKPSGRRRPQAEAAGAPPSKLRTIREEAEAERLRGLRMENERRAGNLVDRQAVEAAVFARARLERDAHLAWVVRAAPLIAAELGVDQARLLALLDAQLREHLEQLSETPLEVLQDAHGRHELG
ncbi:hypothetical protein [Aquibaculum sediminis]|uniref:hypothetical protein n=1 Tax=Aquibaculum sediminis TaxID=3231907 RepID=UPI003453333B